MEMVNNVFSKALAPRICAAAFVASTLIACLFLHACGQNKALEEIQRSGTITMITQNNAHCFYIYRNQKMGFEYDLARAFADFLDVELDVKVAESWNDMLTLLNRKTGHFVAASMAITPSRAKASDFSRGFLPVQQMVITHKKNPGLNSVEDLAGKTIHVRRDTTHEETLRTLSRKGLGVSIQLHDKVATEDLIESVAQGTIEATIADSNVTLLNRRYFPDIRMAFPVEQSQSLGWAVRKGEKALLKKINEFLAAVQQDGTFQDIYNRYYAYLERFDHFDIKKFQQRIKTRLPKYKKTILAAAEIYGIDWRLIAALIYQESQFRPWAKSFSGVRGLMQLTLPTARDMGVKNRLDPHESIMGGTKYLKKLYDVYDKAPEPDRSLIAVAAYNVGKGHVKDARRIAADMNLDPNRWSSLEKTLPLLRQRKYYKKSQYGYCRGAEPVFQVRRVLTYYDILKRQAIKYAGQAIVN